MEKKTSLYDCHVAAGGKMVPFAGYLLPVQYGTGIIAEHMAVREKCGMFDVSHMGELLITGKDAKDNLNRLLTNTYVKIEEGRARYSPMCNEKGGVVDDLIVYCYDQEKFIVVVNAANREKDVEWIRKNLFGDVHMEDISDGIAQIALQGPAYRDILAKLGAEPVPTKYYTFTPNAKIGGIICDISCTGYTGSPGVELYLQAEDAPKLWDMLLEAGKEFGLIPCGLGARDTLRLEAAMPLYGHEMSDDISPLEANLGFAVKLDKEEDFIGKSALTAMGNPKRNRVGIRVTGKGIMRGEEKIFVRDKEVGFTTSGTMCPYVNYAVAMAIIDVEYSELGTEIEAEVRGRRLSGIIVKMPFEKDE